MRRYFKSLVYLIVFSGFSPTFAGSYDDYFNAIQQDNASAISALFVRGFDPNTLDPQGQHGLILALRVPAPKVIQVLLEQAKTQVDARTPQDESPLMLAALKGLAEVCQKLVDRGADVNKPGWTPLHYAATGGHVAIIQMLLDHYAYIDAASPNGSTPLMMAAMYGSAPAVKFLLDAGADSTIKNDLGLTALDFALKAKRQESADLIAGHIRARQPRGRW